MVSTSLHTLAQTEPEREEGGRQGWLSIFGLCQAGAGKVPTGSERIRRLAGLSLPSPCLLPNESSHTTLELEGEGHSFIYITQEISQSTSINHDHYPKSYKITLLTASTAHGLYFSPFLFLLEKKKGEMTKSLGAIWGPPK